MKKEYLYISITKETTALILLANSLKISKYNLFLLYEVFGNDCFLFLELFKQSPFMEGLTNFRLTRCFNHAEQLLPYLHSKILSVPPNKVRQSLEILQPLLYETKFRIEKDA
jgi:hypothetical protein